MAFEEEFGIEIPDDAAEKIQTVGDAISFIKQQRQVLIDAGSCRTEERSDEASRRYRHGHGDAAGRRRRHQLAPADGGRVGHPRRSRPSTRRTSRPRSPARCRRATRPTGTSTPTATCARRTSGRSTSSSSSASRPPEQAVEDSGWKPQDDEEPRPHRRDDRLGHRRPADDLRDLADPEGARTAPRQPVLHPVGADQPRLRPGLDQVRLQGAEPFRGHGLRDRRARDRRRRAADPARGRRRHGGGRRRGRDLPHRHRRLQRLQGAVDRLQRHADPGVAAVGQAARRLRHGRGRGRRRARGVRARQEARRQDLCRGPGLRPVGRRLSHHRAVGGRRRRASAP